MHVSFFFLLFVAFVSGSAFTSDEAFVICHKIQILNLVEGWAFDDVHLSPQQMRHNNTILDKIRALVYYDDKSFDELRKIIQIRRNICYNELDMLGSLQNSDFVGSNNVQRQLLKYLEWKCEIRKVTRLKYETDAIISIKGHLNALHFEYFKQLEFRNFMKDIDARIVHIQHALQNLKSQKPALDPFVLQIYRKLLT